MDVYHIDCGETIFVDITSAFRILVNVGLGTKSLKINQGVLWSAIANKSIDSIFFCTRCSKSIELDKLFIHCDACNNKIGIKEGYRLKSSSGYLSLIDCKSCAEQLVKNGRVAGFESLEDFLKKIWISSPD